MTFPTLDMDGCGFVKFVGFAHRHSTKLQSLHWEHKTSNREGTDKTLAELFRHGLPQVKALRITDPNTSTLNEILPSMVAN
jgi:hypothetical protein